MRLTILGSGTSSGVPVIGCSCSVCTSTDPRNQRLRASAALELAGKVVLFDAGPDLRAQALRFDLRRVDAVLFTHAHADHIHGIDELRLYNLRQLSEIPCFANRETAERLRAYLGYIFDDEGGESMRPILSLQEVEGPFELLGQQVVPVPLWHGKLSVLGYRLGPLAYLTDVSQIPEASWPLLEGLELLVLDALRPKPHPTHLHLAAALEVVERLRPARAVLTHLSHQVDHRSVAEGLPFGVELAYDGMAFDFPDPPSAERSPT